MSVVGDLVLGAMLVWLFGALLFRLAAISCFIVTAGLFANGAPMSHGPARAATYGVACWLASELLYRARRGRWRSPVATRLSARLSRAGATRATAACGRRPPARPRRGGSALR